MNHRSISPVARPLPRYAIIVATAFCVSLLWIVATMTGEFAPSGNPRLGPANPEQSRPRLVSSVTEVDFGTVELGESATERLVLTNSSLDDTQITVSANWLSEPDALVFSSDFRGPRVLAAGDSLIIELRYAPDEAGHRVGALYVSHDGDSNLDIFTLSGNGAYSDASIPSLGGANPVIEPAFGKSELSGISNIKPTSLQFGPDGRLYVADMLGLIKVFEIERDDANDYHVLSEESISLIRDIPNHDDDGDLNAAIDKRLITGLLVAGTASSPIIYVASSDPRIGGGPSHTETGLDTNSGVISRLTRSSGGKWQKLDLVRGLSRSEENHHSNGMVLDEGNQLLYLAAGGNTNQGGPSNNFAKLPEYALSAAILEIDLNAIGDSTYDLPTLDDETRSGQNDKNDPFGGNDGLNQAKLVPGGPVQVYAPGFRNAYDIVLTEAGRLYTIDNGSNSGWGGPPIGEGANGKCSNQQSEPGKTLPDALHYISERGYYGGHPNPTRANLSNTFNESKPQSAVSNANPIECDLIGAGTSASKALTTFSFSTNGLAEYRASNFGGAMQGDLLAAGWNNSIQRLVLNGAGNKLVDKDKLFANVGGLPLDVTAQDDDQYFPGTIWAADFVDKQIVVFEPVDYDGASIGMCGGAPSTDDDNDGFSNEDELANGTDPCSPADLPADLDGDFLSDRVDTDDDGDGLADLDDPFPRDPDNGRATELPVYHEWENDSESAGFLFNLGFSGLMNNGKSEYLDLYSLDNLTTSGAAGVLTIDDIPAGDPVSGKNSQEYAFQFGIDVDADTAPFTVQTRLLAPFSGADIGGLQSMGFYIGTGDQDNYIKLVMNSVGASGSVQFAAEREGAFSEVASLSAPIFGQEEVDLYLSVDPGNGTVRAFYRSGSEGEIVEVGSATGLPGDWLEADSGLAVGIIATSLRGPSFGATWDFIRVTEGAVASSNPEDDTPVESEEPVVDVPTVSDGLIMIEAEDAVENTAAAGHSWVPGSRSGASSSASMIVSPDTGLIRKDNTDTPHMRYQVDFPEAGRWQVWVRGWGDAVGGEGKSDSLHVGVNGTLADAAAMQGFPAGGWSWSNTTRGNGIASVQVSSAGQHSIDVWMREDGFEIDALILSLDKDFMPSGTGLSGQPSSGGDEQGDEAGADDGSDSVDDTGTDAGTDAGSDTSGDSSSGEGSDGAGGTAGESNNDDSNGAGSNESTSGGSTVGKPGSWTTVAQTLDDRTEAIRVQRDDSLWLFNGFDDKIDIRPSIERYSLSDNSWSAISSTLNSPGGGAALTHAGSVMIDDELWLIGGRLGDHPGDVVDQVLIYDFAADAWRQGPDLPEPFAAGGAGVADGRLHVFGGIDAKAQCDVDYHWSLDPDDPGAGWQDHGANSPMPLARNHFSTVVIGNRIYAMGGQHGHDPCSSVPDRPQTSYLHVYDAVKDSWTRLADMPTPQSHAEPSTFVHGGRIWVIGGLVDGDRVMIYDPSTDTWEERPDLVLPQKLLAPSAAIADGRLFVIGGGAPSVRKPTRDTRVIVLPDSDLADVVNVDEGSGNDDAGNEQNDESVDDDQTAVEGVIVIEAEDAVASGTAAGVSWVSGSRNGARGNASMVTSPDSGLIRQSNKNTPFLQYQVSFPEAGEYRVWVRGWGDAVDGEGKSDSVHVGVDGTLAGAAALQGFPSGGWSWSNATRSSGAATVQIDSPGQHTIDVWMREDGFEFDTLILSRDSAYVPEGSGPSEQPASNDGDEAGEGNVDDGDAADEGGSADDTDTEVIGSDGGDTVGADVDGGVSDSGGLFIEAEAFQSSEKTASHEWRAGSRAGASGSSMVTSPDSGTLKKSSNGSPVMRYEIDFSTAGQYRVWVRGWGDADAGEGKSDSLHVGIDGVLGEAAALQGFPAGGWAWSNATRGNGVATLEVDAPGPHTIEVWMREDGLEIDALLLTTDADYVPNDVSGTGTGTGSGSGSGTGDGGSDPVDGTDSSDINDDESSVRAPDTLDWVERTASNGSSATKRHEAGAVEFDGELYLLGGRGDRPVDIYDPVTKRWRQGAAAPFEIHHFQPVVLDDRIWIVGAMTCCYPREDNVDHVWTYTPATDRWEQGAEIPEARRRGSSSTIVRDGKIYLVGGNTRGHDGGAVNWFDEFDPSTGTWSTLPDALSARDHAQGALIDDWLVVAAGRRSTQPSVFSNTIADVDVYDFAAGKWRRGTDIPTTRAGTMAVTVGREVLVIGGESADRSAAHDTVEAYDVDTEKWRALMPLQQGRHSGGAARLNDGVHVVAGATTRGGSNESSSHESLTID